MMDFDDWALVALGYVLEDETWSVFYKWLKTQPHSTSMEKQLKSRMSNGLKAELRFLYLNDSTRELRD